MSVEVSLRHRRGAFMLDVAFEARGGVTALFGPSGAGKTSIVSAIAGLLRPQEGRIAVNGRVLLDTSARLSVPAQARRTAVVFQDSRLFPHMNVKNNLLFGWRRAKDKADPVTVSHVVDLLGLGNLLARHPQGLSGGEKSRVALGRALLASPDMLLLDEPLASLDAARREEILPYLEKLARERRLPMLYVSHSVEEVARLADEIVVLKEGRVAAQGAAFDLLTDVDAIAGAPPLGAVFEATFAEQRADGLSLLAFDGGTLAVARLKRPLGARLRVRLRAEDIMLAREEPRAISANNVLPCVVHAVRANGDQADVQLLCGATRLVARITNASRARLGLEPGVAAFAIVKSVTVEREAG
ncbi:MAG: molybdenum ABC transporter ATP-binding protein [Alphaproteobacteria bacterium]|nr:molybdenum ABC transporter ATP-binding protein [Alphaproteobacteria bacterium]MDE2629904.1 molybdenum ABC transporter ATP-binding protein [Alphaproteobacteria bacterium]